MGGLPETDGPVTIMFTDVEGSTALRTTLGDAASEALFRRHDDLVRTEIAAHQGHDQAAALGDGFLAVFSSTRRAVACAIAIQKALDAFNRTASGPGLKVRIGLNTGEVAWADGQLSGEAVHAAARVCSAATGGQVLVSDVTRQLAGTVPDVTFRDAGEFQLKGFPHPWRLFEVIWVRQAARVHEQVFVGRERELDLLRGHLVDALDGRGNLVLVGGEPGVGKTTLVKQLIREAEQRGALAVFGRCYESEGTIPFSPFVEMLEQALVLMPPDIVREDMGEDAPEVARLVPELRRRFPDIGEPLDLPPEQQRRYFFNAVGSFIARGSHRFPLLLVIDDVHWADEATLLLVEHMAALLPRLRVLGVGTYRDVELDVSRPLALTLERLLRDRLVERVPVRRFDRETVAAMIERMAGKPPPAVVVDAIFDESEGNPFFVEEVFRHLAEDGKLFDGDEFRADLHVDELDVPESVRLVVGRRLERLGSDAQRILAAGAVVGRAFPFRLLEEIVDTDTATLLDVVEAAEAGRVIVGEERGGEVHYSFGHELIRQTLLSGLSVLRRQRLHLAVADAIERTDRRARVERPSEIAHHLLEAGAAADRARTLEFLSLAAERAFEAAAFEEALRSVDDAISIVDRDDRVALARLQERKGWAVRALGRFDECIAIWRDVIEAYGELGFADEAAQLCAETGYQHVWLTRFADAFAVYAQGLALAGDASAKVRVRLLALNGGILSLAGATTDGSALLEEAEGLLRGGVTDDRTVGHVLWAKTMASWSNGQPRTAIVAGRGAVEALRRANDLWNLVDALAWASYPLVLSTQPDEVAEGTALAAEGVALARRLGHRGGEVLARRGALVSEMITGDVHSFERGAREDLEGFRSMDSPWASQSHVMVAVANVLRGRVDEALVHVDEAEALEPVSAWAGVAWGFRVFCLAWRGDAEECRRLVEQRRPSFPGPDGPWTTGTIIMATTTAHACVVAGLTTEAASLYPHLARLVDHLPVTGFDLGLTARVAGMAAAAGRRWDDAEAHFESALRIATGLGHRIERSQVEHWYGEMRLARGLGEDRAAGRELLRAAVEGYRRLGMPLHEARASQALARA